ncbi:hypothetical protein HC928_12635 [bacterium]|nr:hypothetical protein [bacterium]
MPTIASATFVDYDGEQSSVSYNLVNVAADGSNYNAVVAANDLIRSTMAALQRGVVVSERKVIANRLAAPGTRASNAEAQREEKWLVTYFDNQGILNPGADPGAQIVNPNYYKLYNLEIPCADVGIRQSGDNFIVKNGVSLIPAAPAIQAFIDAFNVNARTPTNTTCEILTIQAVGRNT